jgi:hypothetical protein
MIKEQYKYSELTSKIIGCAMTVHKVLGNGFQEVIYQRALAMEMELAGIHFQREFEMPIYNIEIGLLINFGETSLNFKRLTNKKFKPFQ